MATRLANIESRNSQKSAALSDASRHFGARRARRHYVHTGPIARSHLPHYPPTSFSRFVESGLRVA